LNHGCFRVQFFIHPWNVFNLQDIQHICFRFKSKNMDANNKKYHKTLLGPSSYHTWQRGQSWLWSYGSWINNYLCNQYLLPLKLWVRTPFITRCTWYNILFTT
jgi:hypothetical protein